MKTPVEIDRAFERDGYSPAAMAVVDQAIKQYDMSAAEEKRLRDDIAAYDCC